MIGLYIAYAIPIYLRWRAGSSFEQSPVWNLGSKWRWMNPFAVFWVALITIIFCLPFTPAAVPWNDDFSWEAVNYAPLTVGAVVLFAAIAWVAGAKNHFTGQTRNIDIDEALAAEGEQARDRSVTSRRVTLDELKQAVADGTVDTVLLAIADMEGRLQGKRLTASHFLADTLEHGAEGCNYLLAVDVDMETVGGYAMSSWERGYGDFEMVPDLDTPAPRALARGHGDAARRPAVGRRLRGRRLPAPDPAAPARPARRARPGRQRRHRARVHRLQGHLRGGLEEGLPRPRAGQPLQHRLLAARLGAGRAADPPDPQRDGRGGDDGRELQGRVQPRPARDQLPLLARRSRPPTST